MVTENTTQSDGSTSFLRAARAGNLDRVLEHLKNNIDINTSNANGLNALHLASKDGHVHVASELLRRGAIVDSATKKGNTALHIASLAGQEEVVKLLLQHNASVNVQSQNGFTPLYMAAQENHDTVVKLLLSNGANQSLATEDGFTPLAVAMQQGHDKVVAVLLESDTRGKVRLPALHIAAKKDDVKAATLLLDNDHNPDVTSKSGFTPLHIASHYGNKSIANLLIQKGADVNFSAKHNISPLHVAAKWGKTNMVSLLLEKGANIEAKTRDGLTPLHCAARSGHEQVVDMLLERGAPISAKTKNGLAALHMAAQGEHVDAARILLYHRAPVDEVTIDYLTALHVAAHCGHVRVAKLLLDRNADANSRALNGFTPLHIACKKNRIKVVELLLRHGASIGATTESGLTPLHVAAFMGCMNIVIYLLQHDASPDVPTVRGETPLHLAARANQTDIIRILLRNGAQVDARAREQQTPLHIASRLGNVDIVMLLLQHGAQVDAITKDMYTALHISAKEGQDEVAAVLIDNGASLEATTKKGFTALHLAAKYGHAKVAQLLLQKEADVDAQGKNGVTPLHVACHYDKQNVALMLLDKGASPYAIAKNGHTPLHIAARKNQMDIATTLLEYGAQPNAESKAGFTPLHLSSQEGHIELSSLLIEHKASVNHPAKNGLTPTHLCAQEDNVDMADLLLRNGANIDMATKAGYTPLHIACHFGQANMARYLVQHGANVNAATAIGYTPLHQAAQQGHCHIVKLLLERNANANALTANGQTPLNIAQRLGYISVLDSLKSVTSTDETAQPSLEQKYRVVAPEAMHESFMSDSEDEGGDDNILPEQPYRYLTVDEMKSLGDDSLPIDVTRDERVDSNRMTQSTEFTIATQSILEGTATSPYKAHTTMKSMLNGTFKSEHEHDDKRFKSRKLSWKSFLVSFLVDARGGAMRGRRHSGVRMIIPSRSTCQPTRITCRYVKPQRTMHPPQLMEGEALTSRILELGPVATKFLTPVIIEVPHFASLRGKEREIIILRSDNGETWREHIIENSEELIHDILQQCFEPEEIAQLEQQGNNHVCRFVTYDFPQYFAIVSRIRQEVHAIGPEGGMVSSTVVPQVQAVFPQGALTKKIKVGLQAQPVDPDLTAKLLGRGVAVSPIVTVEPRRRKFHKAITLSMPAPKAHSQGMINQYSGNTPTLRLLCSITGGPSRAQWEDVTGSTPLTFVNDCVSFTTTVSARFWLMDCRNISEATKMATELYKEIIHVPFIAKFVVFAKRVESYEARLRVFCMTDDHEDKTLEKLEWFTEVAKSRDVEVLEGKSQYIEMAGNLVPITKSGEQLHLPFKAFRENRLPFTVRVKDQHADIVGRTLFMKEPKVVKGEPPQQPICVLNIVLPEKIVPDSMTAFSEKIPTPYGIVYTNFNRHQNDHYIGDIRIVDLSNLLGKDWIQLASELDISSEEIDEIIHQNSDSIARQAQSMIRLYKDKPNYDIGMLEAALKNIGRDDIMNKCKSRHLSHSQEFYETTKTKTMESIEKYIHEQNNEIRQLNESEELKYSAEEKEVGESESEDESVKRTVAERREKIVKRLSTERQIPASSQKRELTREIIEIKRKSLIEDKKAMHESEIYMQLPADNSVKSSSILSEQVIKMKIGKSDINQIHKNGTDKELLDKLKYSKAQECVDVGDNVKIGEDLKAKDATAVIPKKMLEEISESRKEMMTATDQVDKDKVPTTMIVTKINDELQSEKAISKINESPPQDSNGIKDKIKMFSQHEMESAKKSSTIFKIDKGFSKMKLSTPPKALKENASSGMGKQEDSVTEQSLQEELKSFEVLTTSSIKHISEDVPVMVQQITVVESVLSGPTGKGELQEKELKPKQLESKVEEKEGSKDIQFETETIGKNILTETPLLSDEILSTKLQSDTIEDVTLHKDSFKIPQEESKTFIETTSITKDYRKIEEESIPTSTTTNELYASIEPSKSEILHQQVELKTIIETPSIVKESMKIEEESKPVQSKEMESGQTSIKVTEESKSKEGKLISQDIEPGTITIDGKIIFEKESKVLEEKEPTIMEKRPILKEFFEETTSTDLPVTIQQFSVGAPVDKGLLQKGELVLKPIESEVAEEILSKVESNVSTIETPIKHEEKSTISMGKESQVIEDKETKITETSSVVKELINIGEFEELKSSQILMNLLEETKSKGDKEELTDIQMKAPAQLEQITIITKTTPITKETKIIKEKEATIIEATPIVKEFIKISEEGKPLQLEEITRSQLSMNLLEKTKSKEEDEEDSKVIQMETPIQIEQESIITKSMPIKKESKVEEEKETVIIETTPIVKEFIKISEEGKPLQLEEITSSQLSMNLLEKIKSKEEDEEDSKVIQKETPIQIEQESIITKSMPIKKESKVEEEKEIVIIETTPILKEFIKISEEGKPLQLEEITSSQLSMNLLEKTKSKEEDEEDLKVIQMETPIQIEQESIITKSMPIKKESKVDEEKETVIIETTPIVKEFIKISEEGKPLQLEEITSSQLSMNLLEKIKSKGEDEEDSKVIQMEAPLEFEQESFITKTIPITRESKVEETKIIEAIPDVKVFTQVSTHTELIDMPPFSKEMQHSQFPSDVLEETVKKQEETISFIETTPVVKEFVKISKETTSVSKIPLLSSKPQDIKPCEDKVTLPQTVVESVPLVKEFTKINESKHMKSSQLPIKIVKEIKIEEDKSKIPMEKMIPKEESSVLQERNFIGVIPVGTDFVKISEETKLTEPGSPQSSMASDSQEENKFQECQELVLIEDKEALSKNNIEEITKYADINTLLKEDHTTHSIPTPKEESKREEISENIIDDVRNEAKILIDHVLTDTIHIINEQKGLDKYSKKPDAFPIATDKTNNVTLDFDDSKEDGQAIYEVKQEESTDLSPKSVTSDSPKFTKYQEPQNELERKLEATNIRGDDATLPTPKPRSIKSASPTDLTKTVDESPISESPVPKPRSQIKPMASYTNLAALEKQMDSMDMPDMQIEHIESYESDSEEQDYPQKTSFYIGEPSQIITSSETLQQDPKIQIQSDIPQEVDNASSLGSSTSVISSTTTKESKILPFEEQVISENLKGPDDEEPLVIIDQVELVKRIIPESSKKTAEIVQVEEKPSILNLNQDELPKKIVSDEAFEKLESQPEGSSLIVLEQDNLDKTLTSKTIEDAEKLESKVGDTIQQGAKSPDIIDLPYKSDLDTSSSSSSHYKSFEKSVSRPISSDIMTQIYSSEYQTAIDKEATEFLSAMSSSEKTISSQDSIRSIDSHSDMSVTSVSIDVSELSETLVEEETEEMTDPFEMSAKDDSKNIWNIPDYTVTEKILGSPVTLLRRSPEMTFKLKSEQKIITAQEQFEDRVLQTGNQQFKEEKEASLYSIDNLKSKDTSIEDDGEINQTENEERQGIPIPSSQIKDSGFSKTLPDEAKYASSLSEGSVLSLSVSSTSNIETVIENIENPLLESIETSSLSGLGGSLLHSDESEHFQSIPMEGKDVIEDGDKVKVNLEDNDVEMESDSYDRYETEYSRQFRSPNDVKKKSKSSFKTCDTILNESDKPISSKLKSDSTSDDSLMEELKSTTPAEIFASQHDKTPTETGENIAQLTTESKTDEVKLQEHISQDAIKKSKKLLEEEETFQRMVQEEYKQKLAKLQDPDSKDSSSDDRKAADSPDSFEMVEQPDISEEFIIIEEVAKEANEDELGGKSIRIKQTKYEVKHDEEVEKIIVKSAPADPKLGSQIYKDDMNFEFEESPPTGGGGDESSNGESKESDNNSKEDSISMNRRWVEMQLTDNQLRYPYELTGAVLEDIKEEDAEFEVGSSRINSFKESFSSTPDADTMAARRHHPRGDHDDISMNSLQEFESLEQAISLENRTRNYQGSTDSSSGSFTRRYIARHTNSAGHGDDVISLSSLKEFEGLENACIEAHLIEIKAKEEAALLSRSEESNTSNSNEDIPKNKAHSSPLKQDAKIEPDLINLESTEQSSATTSTKTTTITTTTIHSGENSKATPTLTETIKETKTVTDLDSREMSSTATTTTVTTTTTINTSVKDAPNIIPDKSDAKSLDANEK